MAQPQIFISYRRDDAAGYARAIYDELAQKFGADRVFIDVDDIRAGQAFQQVTEDILKESAVLLVLIGRRWQGPRDAGPPRIADDADLVRQEVAAGLAKGKHVIPLLLDGTPMPAASQLPDALRALTGRNAMELHNTRYADDMRRLIAALGEALGEPPQPPPPPKRRAWLAWGGAGALLVAAGAAALWMFPRTPSPDPLLGEWQAKVTYDWPNANYTERFVFGGDASGLHGSASFLGVPRGLLEGRLEADGISFITRTQEAAGDVTRDTVHRYRGRRVGDELRFVMQTEGGSSAHEPVSFTARRVAPAASR